QWTASIDSKNIPDGPIEVHWVSFDEAGNFVTDSVTTSIANNRPLLAGITLGTDLDGSGTVDADEKEPAFSALDPEGNEQQTATVASDAFVAKTLTAADIDVVGGNGALQYDLSVDGSTLRTLQPLRADELSAVQTVELTEADLGADTSGTPKNLVFTIWDSTEESTPGTDSLSAELTAPILVDIVDEVQPKVVVSPFFWNDESDNSLYENSRENGHIEITGVVNGTDPDVSGQISIRGTAYDDQRLTSLWMAIDGFGFTGAGATSAEFDTDEDGATETLATTYSRMATFSGGTWTGTDQWAGEGWKFTVTESTLDQSGHEVSWQLDWDSSRVSGVAAIDTVIRALAVDKRSLSAGTNTNASSEIENAVPGDVTANNVPAYTVDVVPYVKGLSTDLTGVRDRNIRSATGSYSIQYSDDAADTITITGFNLDPMADGVRVGPDPDGLVGTTLQGQSLTIESVAADNRSVTVRKNATGSGYVALVGGSATTPLPAPNNVNGNLAYHEEPSTAQENPTLNDDRYVRVFDVFDTGFQNAYWHEMIMDGDLPVFGYINDSAANDLQFTRGRVTGESGIGGTATTNEIGLIRGLGFQYYALARDDSGIYHQLSSSTFNSMQQYYIYGEYATDYTGNFGTGYQDFGGATQVYWAGYSGNRAEFNNNDAVVLDELDYDPSLLVGRYKNPRLVARGDSTAAGDSATLYMSFFDSNTGQIIFRNLQVGQDPSGGADTDFNDTGGANMNELDGVTAGDTTRHGVTASASQYFDMGVTDGGVVVIVYYDQSQSRLELVYSATTAGGTIPEPIDGADPQQAVNFSTPAAISSSFVGSYVSMALETDGDPATDDPIHIAAHDSSGADLAYIRLPAFDQTTSTDIDEVTVDANLSVGIWTDIAVRNGTPYIGYYNNSQTGTRDSVKVAWFLGDAATQITEGFDATGVTGDWEFHTVPANDTPQGGIIQFTRVSVGFDTAGNTVVSYLADDLEYARILPDIP
ncbi:MAG: hypothetical protein GVY14_01925, partial [Spirochaetes bacterium]|nr:hypothetical protein [Spirochaetota bacterium]